MLGLISVIFVLIILFAITYHIIISQQRWEYTLRAMRESKRYSHYHDQNVDNQDQQPPPTCPDNACAQKERDNLTFLTTMLLSSKFKNNPNVANGNCIAKVMSQAVPIISKRIAAQGLDSNKIDYQDPIVKAIVNDVVSSTMATGICSGMVLPPKPAFCPTPKVNYKHGRPR